MHVHNIAKFLGIYELVYMYMQSQLSMCPEASPDRTFLRTYLVAMTHLQIFYSAKQPSTKIRKGWWKLWLLLTVAGYGSANRIHTVEAAKKGCFMTYWHLLRKQKATVNLIL